ncbi:serine/threonine-protein kinase [Agrococcus baldri]|uniref:non-specific serine/threonine protein kinase n=1 Tax=Agrococcus baldri TaxID=153730 RepID=A0AA87USQ2_9MICO|nr:serine/threonine-protein kinase [Agrococcus baldri]GEK80625.1 hypothetical protein ABA31_19760 [Agrococcus baldri]
MPGVDPLAPGSLLAGRYRIGSLLGAGGMSFVHSAVDETLGREVAVKALVRTSAEPVELERIGAEIDLLATLSHRALVTLFDAGTAAIDGRAVTYLVMELVDGPTLGARVAAGPIAPVDIAHLAHDVAEALVVVHAHGVVHRDVKPANILLAPSPVAGREFSAKLADFGIAAIIDGDRLTATGTVLGTAAYLSPEQAGGARVGPASDIYSLGLVLLETLTGHREYPGALMESLSARHSRDPQIPDAIGEHWTSLLTAMTARDPDARPTADAVLDRLAAAPETLLVPTTTGTAVVATPAVADAMLAEDDTGPDTKELAAPPDRRRRRGLAIAAAVTAGLAILAAVVVVAMQGIGLPRPDATTGVTESSQQPADLVTETSAPPTPTPSTGTSEPGGTDGGEDAPPTESAPTPSTPADTAPAETAPAETAPAETAPAETVPAETDPAETAPAEPDPGQPEPSAPPPAESAPPG